VTLPKENPSLQLLAPPPQTQLLSWLSEFYGKKVEISQRELLRHRDLSYVERLWNKDGLPASLIYKVVLPPWDVEADLHEHVLIPSISNSAQLYLTAHYGPLAALFLEDLGCPSLLNSGSAEIAGRTGEELAKMSRAYSYRTDELAKTGILRTIAPLEYVAFTEGLILQLEKWNLLIVGDAKELVKLAKVLASRLAGEPTSLVHGDLFAENIILRGDRLYIIDWSWFTILGVPLMDLATLCMTHQKNGNFPSWKKELLEGYCRKGTRQVNDVIKLLPWAETLSRLFFLHWLIERKTRGILGTTIGLVDGVIPSVVNELKGRLAVETG